MRKTEIYLDLIKSLEDSQVLDVKNAIILLSININGEGLVKEIDVVEPFKRKSIFKRKKGV